MGNRAISEIPCYETSIDDLIERFERRSRESELSLCASIQSAAESCSHG